MHSSVVHRETVAPGLAPGGIWVRVCTRTELLSEYAMTERTIPHRSALLDAELTLQALKSGKEIWIYFYDGDDGTCMGTIIGHRIGFGDG
jgi:hypothetical protein